MEGELGLKTAMNKDMVRDANFVLKQVIPYYDRYCAPYFQGIDNDVTEHAMPAARPPRRRKARSSRATSTCCPTCSSSLPGPASSSVTTT